MRLLFDENFAKNINSLLTFPRIFRYNITKQERKNMDILIGFLYVVEVAVCLLLALVVMLQKPKEGGLGGAIGGGMMESALGADAGNVLIKTTAILGAIFLLNTLALARLTSTAHSRSLMDADAPAAVEEALPELPFAGGATPSELPAAPAEAPAPVEVPAPATPAAVEAPAAPAAVDAPAPATPAPVEAPATPAPVEAPAQ